MQGVTASTGRLRVAVVSKSDATGGGASRVAWDLTEGLSARGHTAVHWSAYGATDARHRSLYGPPLAKAATNLGRTVFRKLGLTEGLPIELPAMIASGIARDFDVVHFHDLTTAISPLTVAWFARRVPTFWTFHDFSPFTGGCIFPGSCERFTTACGSEGGCPQINVWPLLTRFDHTGRIQAVKTRLHRSRRVHTITPSAWMADEALRSGKIVDRPAVISNGVDVDRFRPAPDRSALRRELGLPLDRPVIVLSAPVPLDPRKGVAHAVAAVRSIDDATPFVVLVGGDSAEVQAMLAGIDCTVTGYVKAATDLARWYGAGDVLLNCSLAESQGLTVLESMACGVPMIAFASGGIPAMIVDGETGILVPPLDAAALTAALRRILEPGVAGTMGRAARARAETTYATPVFLDQHVAAYRAALG